MSCAFRHRPSAVGRSAERRFVLAKHISDPFRLRLGPIAHANPRSPPALLPCRIVRFCDPARALDDPLKRERLSGDFIRRSFGKSCSGPGKKGRDRRVHRGSRPGKRDSRNMLPFRRCNESRRMFDAGRRNSFPRSSSFCAKSYAFAKRTWRRAGLSWGLCRYPFTNVTLPIAWSRPASGCSGRRARYCFLGI